MSEIKAIGPAITVSTFGACDGPVRAMVCGTSPDSEIPLASGSTWNRFLHADTRREHEKPLEDRRTLFECRDAQLPRIRGLNEFLRGCLHTHAEAAASARHH